MIICKICSLSKMCKLIWQYFHLNCAEMSKCQSAIDEIITCSELACQQVSMTTEQLEPLMKTVWYCWVLQKKSLSVVIALWNYNINLNQIQLREEYYPENEVQQSQYCNETKVQIRNLVLRYLISFGIRGWWTSKIIPEMLDLSLYRHTSH